MNNLLEKSRSLANKYHSEVNHTYDHKPYTFHLNMVEEFGQEFIYLINSKKPVVLSACQLHDTCEDCRITYNDLKKEVGEEVANIVYAVTNEKGKNRAERANTKYYKGIRKTEFATFVKLADRLANVSYSKTKGKEGMFEKYKKENPKFVYQLTRPDNFLLKLAYGILSLTMSEESYFDFLISIHPYKDMIKRLNNMFL